MQRLFKALLGGNRPPTVTRETRRAGSRRVAPVLEGMEERKMLTAGVSLAAGVLTVTGTEHGDTVAFFSTKYDNAAYNTVNVDWTHDNTTTHLAFPVAGVN